jgi:DNA-binding beta-propeller fold protein YncE
MTTTEANPAAATKHSSAQAKHGVLPLRYEVDPTWPKPLPKGWTFGRVGGLSITDRDEIVICHRQDITDEEAEISVAAPMVVVFDTDGNVVKSWGDQKDLPITPERLNTDYKRNIWIPGQRDGQVHKYDMDGNLLLKIGQRGVFDSHDGTIKGYPLNAAKDLFFKPCAVAVDPTNDHFYIADGYGNRRLVEFDANAKYVRQWGRQGTVEEIESGAPWCFANVVHDIVISNEGLLYICDRWGNRIHVYKKDGTFVRNIWTRVGRPKLPDGRGTAWTMVFSHDADQKLIYLQDGRNEQFHIIDHASGEIVYTYGRTGHQIGAFTHGHTIGLDSMNNIYVAETATGRRVQRFKPIYS